MNMSTTDELVHTLRSFGLAYPEDMFGPVTDAERKEHSNLITRNSAAMGRHCAKFMAQAADMIEALSEPAAPVDARVAALLLAQRMCREALPKFNWGASFLDANAIQLLNEAPAAIDAALARQAAAPAEGEA